MGQSQRLAAARSTISRNGTTITLADATTIKAIVGQSDSQQVERVFGALTIAQLMDRGASDISMLSVAPADYSAARFSRPFTIGSGESAQRWQCERAVPVRDGEFISYWQLLIYTGGLLNE